MRRVPAPDVSRSFCGLVDREWERIPPSFASVSLKAGVVVPIPIFLVSGFVMSVRYRLFPFNVQIPGMGKYLESGVEFEQ